MKNSLIHLVAKLCIAISKHYDGNVSSFGYYKPKSYKHFN